jgi:multidrug efflux pump subunit AcrA (membrane-fusion protein)
MNTYELRSAVSLGYADQLGIGQKVTFTSPDVSGSWSGKITRIAPVVDGASQSVSVVVTLQGNKLREGMYLTGQIKGVEVMNALRLPASMVFDNSYVFAIERDSVLAKISVEVVEWLDNEVIVRGIGQGTMLVNEPSLKAASGLVVTPVK